MQPCRTVAGHNFPRAFRLKRRRLIRPLFDRSKGDVGFINVGVVQIRYRIVPRTEVGIAAPLQIGFAPGSRTRTKVGRNRVRRVMREAFRHNQYGLVNLFEKQGDCLTMMVLFRGKEATAGDDIRRDLPEALTQLEQRFTDAA